MRADRLISILLILQDCQRITARQLAERLEVSPRTILRDMEVLSGVGIPVYAERGRDGGWSLLEPYRTNLNGLNLAEIQTVFLAQPAKILDDLGLSQTAEIALLKLLAALPSAQQQAAETVRQRIHIDLGGWHPMNEDVSLLPVIQEAIWAGRRLHITYRRADHQQRERLLDPLGLVAKGAVWYLVALVDDDYRTYRVSRIQAAVLTNEPCRRPPDFDLVAYWEETTRDFVAALPQFDATLYAHHDVMERLKIGGRFVRISAVHPSSDDAWSRVEIRADTIDEACRFVVGFGGKVKVLSPDELRICVVRLAREIMACYKQSVNPE